MSLFTATTLKKPSKVHFSQYLRTENKPDEPTDPPEPAESPKPAAQ